MTQTTAVDAGTRAEAVLEALDDEQRLAAQAVNGPVCILAGAGTGKTLLACDEALRLAEEGRRTLFACYGGRLALHVRPLLEPAGVTVSHLHGLMRDFIDRVFRKYLTPRERKILYLYYGLEEGSEAMTLERIGALMGVTRERIRQIRERAFEKLRESPDGSALAGFWTAA